MGTSLLPADFKDFLGSVQAKHKEYDVALDTFTHLPSALPSKASSGPLLESADKAALVNTTQKMVRVHELLLQARKPQNLAYLTCWE